MRFELVISNEIVKALDLTIPLTLLIRADEAIEYPKRSLQLLTSAHVTGFGCRSVRVNPGRGEEM